jgi:ABC-type uncharacterized transport system substrate-binding protein
VSRLTRTQLISALAGTTLLASAATSSAHPHVLAEASLEVTVDGTGAVEALRHVWRFDDLFSSTVLLEFDKNADLELDGEELDQVGAVIHESLAEFDYFQVVRDDGKRVDMQAPERIVALFEDRQLTILFESRPKEVLAIAGKLEFGVYDPTFYTAIDFYEDTSLSVTPLPEGCARSVVRPDPDEALAMNQDALTDAFFDDPSSVDNSKLFATRLELDCTAGG